MNRYVKVFIVLVIVGVLAADLYFDYRSDQARLDQAGDIGSFPIGTSVGELAPDFTGTTVDGQKIQLRDLRGKTVLINIFATWCGPCIAETPHLVEAFNASGEDVAFIGLNLLETPGAVAEYQNDYSVSYPLVLDQEGRLTGIYQPRGLPTSWFIDPDGVIRYVHTGPMTTEIIQRAISDVQAGRQVDIFAPAG